MLKVTFRICATCLLTFFEESSHTVNTVLDFLFDIIATLGLSWNSVQLEIWKVSACKIGHRVAISSFSQPASLPPNLKTFCLGSKLFWSHTFYGNNKFLRVSTIFCGVKMLWVPTILIRSSILEGKTEFEVQNLWWIDICGSNFCGWTILEGRIIFFFSGGGRS